MTSAWAPYVPSWSRMIRAYKKDQSKPNPFEEPNTGRFTFVSANVVDQPTPTDNALKDLGAQLAKEESEQRKAGKSFPHKTSPAEFLQQALDIEEEQ